MKSFNFKLIFYNLFFVFIIGYLTLDINANFNSRLGGLVICLMMAYYFYSTIENNIPILKKLINYGSSSILYIIATSILCFQRGIRTALIPILLVYLFLLLFPTKSKILTTEN